MTSPAPEQLSGAFLTALMLTRTSLRKLERTSHNSFQKFNFVSAEDTIAQCKMALLARNIFVESEWDHHTTKDNWIAITFRVHFMDHETAKTETLIRHAAYPVVARSGMPEDKAVNCATTAGIAYWFRGFLMLPRVEKGTDIDFIEDSDHDILDSETLESVGELLSIMRNSQPSMTEPQLTSILRARAQSANIKLDKTFVDDCISKASKGKTQ